ncbi:hypothetical protein HID58_004685, partial [Brassica napus]
CFCLCPFSLSSIRAHLRRVKTMAALERSQPPGTSSAMRNAFGTVLSALILVLIGVLAFSIRLFSVSYTHISAPLIYSNKLGSRSDYLGSATDRCSLNVIKYESVIHEFDPYFNYRVTQFLSNNGIYEFWNWFDDRTWYPLGRVIGGTVYPGLTLTAGTIWWVLNSLNIPLSVETVCVFTAPVFSAFASWATYLLTKEVKGSSAALAAAALLTMLGAMTTKLLPFLL